MKRLLVIAYWIISVLLVATVLSSVGYRFPEALLIGTMFLPGALAAKFFFPKVNFKNRSKGIREAVFIVLGILAGEILLFLLTHFYITGLRKNHQFSIYELPDIPSILTNPVFIAIVLTALAAGCWYFESWLERKRPGRSGPVSFTSERKRVNLHPDEILYVESNDDATLAVTKDGRRFKNYTPISQWEALLGSGFLRIHRSYLVNKSAVTRVDVDLLYLGELQLPISRKYRDAVVNTL